MSVTERLPSVGDLLARTRDLCRLRGGPQDIPHSPLLFGVLLASSVVLDVGIGTWIGADGPLLPRSLLSTALILGLCWIALAIRGLRHRYLQTACALLACGMAFSIVILPLALSFGTLPEGDAGLTPGQTAMAWLGLGLMLWQLAVGAHVMRQAIEAPFALAFALVLSWSIADWALGEALFAGTP